MNIDLSKIDSRTVTVKDEELLVRTNIGGKDVAYTVMRFRDYWDGTRGILVVSLQFGQRAIVSTYPYSTTQQLFERELINACSDFEEKIRNLMFAPG
jgi:hypothetical protein